MRACIRYELTLLNSRTPHSRKNVMMSSAGTNPMKMYDVVSLRRTCHSRRWRRVSATICPTSPMPTTRNATLPAKSITSSATESAAIGASAAATSFNATPATKARPGSECVNQRLVRCRLDDGRSTTTVYRAGAVYDLRQRSAGLRYRRPETEDRRPKTGDRRPKTEDRL